MEDHFTSTVSGAAAYEAYRSRDYDYNASDARADDADDAWQERVDSHLYPLVEEVEARVDALAEQIKASGQDQPHPWTWERRLLALLEQGEEHPDGGGEDALRGELVEHFRDEAEELAREEAQEEAYNRPCCRSYDCPCGG